MIHIICFFRCKNQNVQAKGFVADYFTSCSSDFLENTVVCVCLCSTRNLRGQLFYSNNPLLHILSSHEEDVPQVADILIQVLIISLLGY